MINQSGASAAVDGACVQRVDSRDRSAAGTRDKSGMHLMLNMPNNIFNTDNSRDSSLKAFFFTLARSSH